MLRTTTNDVEGEGGFLILDKERRVLGRGRTPTEAYDDAAESYDFPAAFHHRCTRCGHLDMDPDEPFETVACDEACLEFDSVYDNGITRGNVQWEHWLNRYVWLDWAWCIGCRDKYERDCAVCHGNGIEAEPDEDPMDCPAPDPGPGGRGLLRFVDLIHGREPHL